MGLGTESVLMVRPRVSAFKLAACCLMVLICFSAKALDATKRVTQFVHDVWTTEDGLPQNSVSSVIQSQQGFLWFGTQEGLVRFDGVEFDVFDKFNVPAMNSSLINAMTIDGQDDIWFSTESGRLLKFASNGVGVAELIHQFEPATVTFMVSQGDKVWVATIGQGVWCFSHGVKRSWSQEEGLPDDRVWWLDHDQEGQILACTSKGMARISASGVSVLSSQSTWSVAPRSAGGLWVGTTTGLQLWENEQVNPVSLADVEPAIYTMCEDRDGGLWIGTPRDGIYRYVDGRVEHFDEKMGLNYNSVLTIFEDHEGSIWIGTDGGGLERFRDASVTTVSAVEGLPNDMVRSVLADREGRLWIGTDGGGAVCFDQGEMRTFDVSNGLSDNRVLCVNEDRLGRIWISTYGGGVNFFDGDRIESFTVKDGLPTMRAGTVTQTRDGTVWVATQLGLVALREGLLRTYTTADGLNSNLICNLHESRDGTLWIATRGGGLNTYRNGVFHAITTEDGLSSNQILALYEHDNGDLWVGTSDGGLNLVRPGLIATIDSSDGLFDDKVLEILKDGQGHFWFSSNKGIFTVPIAELYQLVEGQRDRINCRVFRSADGMKSSECNGGSAPAGTVDHQGVIWFPTIKGVARIDPNSLVRNTVSPTMAIKEVRADGDLLEFGGPMVVPSTVSKLEIRFAALSLRVPERVNYKYRLKGVDRDWQVVGSRRNAVYTNLAAGLFVFEVMGTNDDGIWCLQPASVDFRFVAPWYASLWLRSLLALIMLALLWLGYQWRQKSLGRRELQLATLIEQRATGLRESSRRLIDAQDQMVDAAHRAGMAEIAKSVLGQVQDTLHQVDAAAEDLGEGATSIEVSDEVESLALRLSAHSDDRFEFLTTSVDGSAVLDDLRRLPLTLPKQRGRLLDTVGVMMRRFQQLNRLIAAQQDFAKIERTRDEIDINQIAMDAIKLKSELLRRLEVEVVQDLAPLPPLQGRRSLMLRALVNLIQNSCEAMEEAGSLARVIRMRSFRDRFGIHLEITDTGPGIAVQDSERVFSQGFTTKETHAGLGLHTTANAVAQLGGVIRLVLEHQGGTMFRVSFYDTSVS